VDFFKKKDHSAILYFCFADDGMARHRSLVFKQWCKELPKEIDFSNKQIAYKGDKIYNSLLILKDNPLKDLITNAFYTDLEEIAGL
jgi:hypothetical protein